MVGKQQSSLAQNEFSEQKFQQVLPTITNGELSESDIILQNNNNCQCVTYYLCDDENYIVTSGAGIISQR